jgi:threonine/homoserine/homoserine lactone efflux protein
MLGHPSVRPVIGVHLRFVAAAIPGALVAWGIAATVHQLFGFTLWTALGTLLGAGPMFLLGYAGALTRLRVPEVRQIRGMLIRR